MKCPHCLHSIHAHWHTVYLQFHPSADANLQPFKVEDIGFAAIRTAACSNCHKHIIQFGHAGEKLMTPANMVEDSYVRFVQPLAFSRSPLGPDVPDEFSADYMEACTVLPN